MKNFPDMLDRITYFFYLGRLENVHHADIVCKSIDGFLERKGRREHRRAVRGHGLHREKFVHSGVGNVGTQLKQQGFRFPRQPCIVFEDMVTCQVNVEWVRRKKRITLMREGFGGITGHSRPSPLKSLPLPSAGHRRKAR